MLNKINKILVVMFLSGVFSLNFAQTTISGGADFVSRYVWRGLDLGNTFSIQPALTFNLSNLKIGFWGSYPLVNTANGNEEMDLFLEYSWSNFSVLLTDYYFPNSGLRYGLYKEPGAHTFEIGLSYIASKNFPISLSAFMNIYNDVDNTIYFEVEYSTKVNTVNVDFFMGGTPGGEEKYYGTKDLNLINVGVTASKNISLINDFILLIYSSYILNPNLEVGYLMFGLNLEI